MQTLRLREALRKAMQLLPARDGLFQTQFLRGGKRLALVHIPDKKPNFPGTNDETRPF